MGTIPIGQFNNETAKTIYKNCRQIIDIMVKTGKIEASDADKEWAKLVAKRLTELGFPVPKEIQRRS